MAVGKRERKMSDFRIDGSWFDCLDPLYKEIQIMNKRPMLRYHLLDGRPPRVVDIEEEYPREKYGRLKFIYDRGYIWVGMQNGTKLFESNHVASMDRKDVEDYVRYLIILRTKDWFEPDIKKLGCENASVLINYYYVNEVVASVTIELLQEHFGAEFEKYSIEKDVREDRITILMKLDGVEMYEVIIEKGFEDENEIYSYTK